MVMRAGLSLVEVIVAMALLSITAIGVAASGIVAAQSFARAELRERVLQEAGNTLDSLLALRTNGSGEKAVQQMRISWSAADSAQSIEMIVTVQGREIRLSGRR